MGPDPTCCLGDGEGACSGRGLKSGPQRPGCTLGLSWMCLHDSAAPGVRLLPGQLGQGFLLPQGLAPLTYKHGMYTRLPTITSMNSSGEQSSRKSTSALKISEGLRLRMTCAPAAPCPPPPPGGPPTGGLHHPPLPPPPALLVRMLYSCRINCTSFSEH